MRSHSVRMTGFTLLPVILTMTLIAAIAFLLNRDNGMNTSMVSHQMDTDRARYAAEAGLQAANAKIQSLGCTGGYPVVGAPVTNTSFGGASYSAYATSASGNTTSLVSTGTYNGSSVKLTRNDIYVYQLSPKTYTLQPNATAGMDTYITTNSATNRGNSDSLQMSSTNFPLIKFDLSMFPAGSRPVSSTLSLYANGGFLAITHLYRMTGDWQEGTGASGSGANWTTSNGTAAWNAAGGDYHPVIVNTVSGTLGNWLDFDATDLTISWLSGSYPNYGMRFTPSTALGSLNFVSSDDSDTIHHPKITFNYLVPCGATGPLDPTGGTLTLNPIADAYVDNGATQKTLNYGVTTLLQTFTGGRAAQMMAKFDVSTIPAGTVIKTATLRYNVSTLGSKSSNIKPITAYKLIESWIEGTKNGSGTADGVTALTRDGTTVWTNASGTYDVTAIAMATEESSGISPPPGTFSSGWLTWDITTLVQEWVDGVSVNNGVILVPSTISGKDKMSFDSREASSNKPQLVVTY